MKLSAQHIQSFIECWREDFGETLAPELAAIEAARLLDFIWAMADLLDRKPVDLGQGSESTQ